MIRPAATPHVCIVLRESYGGLELSSTGLGGKESRCSLLGVAGDYDKENCPVNYVAWEDAVR